MDYATNIYVEVYNQQGQNLLAPSSILNEGNIEIYVVKNGQSSLYYNGNSGYPKGFSIKKLENGQEALTILTNDINEEFPIKILKLSNYPPDTIKSQLSTNGNLMITSKVWHNNIVKYDGKIDKTIAKIKIIK